MVTIIYNPVANDISILVRSSQWFLFSSLFHACPHLHRIFPSIYGKSWEKQALKPRFQAHSEADDPLVISHVAGWTIPYGRFNGKINYKWGGLSIATLGYLMVEEQCAKLSSPMFEATLTTIDMGVSENMVYSQL